MLKIDRQKMIEEELRTYGSVHVSEMSLKLGCSEETVRRDIKDLESQNKLKRIHGGAYLSESNDVNVPSHIQKTVLLKEKERMASYICNNFLKEDDVLMLDCSTTCQVLARRIILSKLKVTIITNSLYIFSLFEPQPTPTKLIAIGGQFKAKSGSFSGIHATTALTHYMADKSFISCPAIDKSYGLLDHYSNESQVRKSFIEHSRQLFFVGDHTKFSSTADYIIAGLKNIDVIVTDKRLSTDWENSLSSYPISINYC